MVTRRPLWSTSRVKSTQIPRAKLPSIGTLIDAFDERQALTQLNEAASTLTTDWRAEFDELKEGDRRRDGLHSVDAGRLRCRHCVACSITDKPASPRGPADHGGTSAGTDCRRCDGP